MITQGDKLSTPDELKAVLAEIGRCISDPMWDSHAEVSKTSLKRWHKAILNALKESAK